VVYFDATVAYDTRPNINVSCPNHSCGPTLESFIPCTPEVGIEL
jgi:hypothetical protein